MSAFIQPRMTDCSEDENACEALLLLGLEGELTVDPPVPEGEEGMRRKPYDPGLVFSSTITR